MPLDRLAGEEERVGDLRITVAGSDERRDLALPLAQFVQRGLTAGRPTANLGERWPLRCPERVRRLATPAALLPYNSRMALKNVDIESAVFECSHIERCE